MSGAEVMGAIAVAGTAASVYGSITGAEKEQEAAQKNLEFKRIQADEMLRRQAINDAMLARREQMLEDQQLNSYSGTGTTATGLGDVLRMREMFNINQQNARDDASFKVKILRAGADVESQLLSDRMTASYITGTGTILTGAARAYDTFGPKPSNPQQGISPAPRVDQR